MRSRETGETAELLVLAELYRRGVLGGQAARGIRGIDLLTSTGPTIQVKAMRGVKGRWVLGQEGKRPSADLVVLVSVGDDHSQDLFFVCPTGTIYDWVEDRHRAYWETRGDTTGETGLMQIRYSDSTVAEWLEDHRDRWDRVVEPGS
jgi:hypothetical protein